MSRCFPFPPPGYEKKTRPDDVELLTKEKHKEKKHKKDKKDKDKDKDKDKKREGKEKKDKERSKDKHKEKKDRKDKDKHKDKDKKKDKDGDKDKSKILAEKKPEGIPEGHVGGRPAENFQQTWEIKNPKSADVLDRGIGDEERRTGNHMVETFNGNDKWCIEGISRVAEKDFERRGEADKKVFSKQPDVQRKTDVDGWTGGATVQSFSRLDQKGTGKDSNVDKGHDRKGIGQRNFDGKAVIGNAVVQNFTTGTNEKKIEGVARLIDKDAEKVKEKSKSKGSDDKHKKREKKSKGKDKDRDKEKEKTKEREKAKDKGGSLNNKQDKLIGSGKDIIDTLKPLPLPKDINNGASMEGSSRKRKEPEANGFLHENESRPNKLLKPVLPVHPIVENGRKLEPSQIATQGAPEIKQGPGNNLKVDNKEHKVNGLTEAQPTSINSTKSSLVSSHASENGVASTKPPHPDAKYLSQILSIPKIEEWSDFDDQDWLFGENTQLKKPRGGSFGVEERPQVWAEAVRIESADVCALPYVIPY
ncbi:pre-mRNA-splicing factor CWC22 homolog isoform X2 [Papaver somniferum]|uniref:pre-mRNA-splicing factor CWC22 homolog isoform X2 n=1 Tax=Papaver somniferum TaxID=3469 RepID=UPI000E6FB278|nr:pre-mRNA-splicing factor CWC22 homolog isoform X2 [Papaver somniferum]